MIKFFSVIISVLIMLSFAGCSKNVIDNDDGVIVVNKGEKIYYEGKEDEAQVLKIAFTEAGFGREWLVEISKKFIRNNTGYVIQLDGDPSLAGSIATKLESKKNLADIYMPLNSAWENYAYRGWIEPLNDLYAKKPDGESGKTIEAKTAAQYLEYSKLTVGGETNYYVLPWNDTVTGIVYNAKMFSQYGWEIPKTTQELKTLCDKIITDTKSKVKPFAYPGKIGGYFDYIGMTWWMQSSGTESLKEFFEFASPEVYNQQKQPALGKKLALEEFVKFFDINTGYGVSGSMSKDHITSQMDFINGNAAMIINGNWMETEMKTSLPSDFEMRMMSVPLLPSAQKDSEGNNILFNYTTAPDYIFIPKDASNKTGAKLFLEYMTSSEMLKLYTNMTGSPRPFDYDMLAIEGLSSFSKDVLKLKSESISFFDYSRAATYMSGYTQKFLGGQPYAALVRGETTPERFGRLEYVEADENWTTWLANSRV